MLCYPVCTMQCGGVNAMLVLLETLLKYQSLTYYAKLNHDGTLSCQAEHSFFQNVLEFLF